MVNWNLQRDVFPFEDDYRGDDDGDDDDDDGSNSHPAEQYY